MNQDEQDTAPTISYFLSSTPHRLQPPADTSLDDTQPAPHGYVLLLPRLREAADLDPLTEEDAVGRPAKVEHAAV